MTYVDGFVFPVPKKNFKAYKKMALDAGKVWKKFGALDYKECIGEEMNPKSDPNMKVKTFPKLVNPKSGEQVWFSFIVYKSKTHRNQVNKKVMNYFNKKYANAKHQKMPFDVKRMAYGGFQSIVDL